MKTFLRFPVYETLDRETARWWVWLQKHFKDIDSDIHLCTAGPDKARNEIVEQFLSSDTDQLWMVDCDVVPPRKKKLVNQFLSSPHDVSSGIYCGYKSGKIYPQVFVSHGSDGAVQYTDEDEWPEGSWFKTGATGAGCLLIKRKALETKPWFRFVQFGHKRIGEDITFTREHGVCVMKDFLCAHYRDVDLTSIWLNEQKRKLT